MRVDEEYSSAPKTAAYLALLTERNELRNRCKELTLKTSSVYELAAKAKERRVKLTEYEIANTATKGTLANGQKKN